MDRIKPVDTKQFDVAVVGEINVDLILQGNVEPEFNQVEKIVHDCRLSVGSSAVIFACGAARLGLKTAFIGIAGEDTFGRFMVSEMEARGIDTAGIILKSGLDTGISVILARQTDRAILTYPGSIPELTLTDIDLSILSRSRHLHLASYFLLERLRPKIPQLFEKARQVGCSISMDTNYDPTQQWNAGLLDALKQVDIFLPNATEIKAITRAADLLKAIEAILQLGPAVAVKLGQDGAIAASPGGEVIRQQALPVEVVDTVGAGDSFDAGFIYGYLNGMDWPTSLKLATICGSLSTQKSGGIRAQPTLDQALQLLQV